MGRLVRRQISLFCGTFKKPGNLHIKNYCLKNENYRARRLNRAEREIKMEAAYKKTILQRLDVLNGMKAICENLRYNSYETIKGMKVVIERQDGTTITEELKEHELVKIADDYMAEQNRLNAGLDLDEIIKAVAEYMMAQQAS